jgi:hypothetical protein
LANKSGPLANKSAEWVPSEARGASKKSELYGNPLHRSPTYFSQISNTPEVSEGS